MIFGWECDTLQNIFYMHVLFEQHIVYKILAFWFGFFNKSFKNFASLFIKQTLDSLPLPKQHFMLRFNTILINIIDAYFEYITKWLNIGINQFCFCFPILSFSSIFLVYFNFQNKNEKEKWKILLNNVSYHHLNQG